MQSLGRSHCFYTPFFYYLVDNADNGVGGHYNPSGHTIKENALLACESVYGTGKCSSDACGSCNDKGYHSVDIANPCNGATMWNYANQNSNLGCGWKSCSEVIISLNDITWEPSCSNGGNLIHYCSHLTIRNLYNMVYISIVSNT